MNTPIKKLEKQLERELIASPLGDNDIKFFLPDAKIIKYSDLKKYSKIEDLLPNNKDYVICLYENQLNCGHWVSLMRYKIDDTDLIEFFDSLADDGKPDSQLKWISKEMNKKLGQGKPILTNLLSKTSMPVIYNKFKFQSESNKKDGDNINTCGKHCIYRIKNLLDCDYSLKEYIDLMNEIKDESGNTFDEIVSHLVL